MKKLIDACKSENIIIGWLFAYVHFVVEVTCFYFVAKATNNSPIVWLIPLVYDGLAFAPQAVIGNISDKHPNLNMGVIGMGLMALSYLLYFTFPLYVFIPLTILCIGNGFVHVHGAQVTLKNSKGKLAHSAIFVGGGSFGVILGRLLATTFVPYWAIWILILTSIPFILLADTYYSDESSCKDFNYANPKVSPMLVVLLATFVVIVRGYVGYAIPTSWNTTVSQTVALFFIMGIGKALGGLFADAYGVKKTAIICSILAWPFLCLGDHLMYVSLIGVMLFSMTMSITLAAITSVLKNKSGLGFGFTTIGLFLGTAPIFYIKAAHFNVQVALITLMTLICTVILSIILKKDEVK